MRYDRKKMRRIKVSGPMNSCCEISRPTFSESKHFLHPSCSFARYHVALDSPPGGSIGVAKGGGHLRIGRVSGTVVEAGGRGTNPHKFYTIFFVLFLEGGGIFALCVRQPMNDSYVAIRKIMRHAAYVRQYWWWTTSVCASYVSLSLSLVLRGGHAVVETSMLSPPLKTAMPPNPATAIIQERQRLASFSTQMSCQVGVLLKREEELTTALEEEAAARERERKEYHHSTRQVKKSLSKLGNMDRWGANSVPTNTLRIVQRLSL